MRTSSLQRLTLPLTLAVSLLFLMPLSLPSASYTAPTANTCFVKNDSNGFAYAGGDGTVIQLAIIGASDGDTLKIAGTCAVSSSSPVADITKNLTLVGGYANGNWNATPDPVANPIVLDAADHGRGRYAGQLLAGRLPRWYVYGHR